VIVILALVVAVAAAVRSTWSPCGLSMLSSITPMTEQGRGHRFVSTATWFVVGAVVGGATLGLVVTIPTALVQAAAPAATTVLVVAAIAALVGALSDLRPFGWHLPYHGRQVNEDWLAQYRAWVYGAGFGWQIGVGLATYIMTAAVYLLIVLAVLTASPSAAFGICVLFGLVRGLAIFLGAGMTSPARMRAFHLRFDALREPVRVAVVAVQLAVAAAAGLALWTPAVGAVVAIGAVAAAVIGLAVVAGRRPSSTAVPA
jgi:hypothetical protein